MIQIMMPFFGDPELLRLAVESVIAQESPDWQLVVVDNHYPDSRPGEWVSNLGDSRVSYLRNEKNLGVNGNLRRCLEVSTAPYVVIMGADDLLHPNYVSLMNRAVTQYPEATFLQPRVRVVDQHGRATRPLTDLVKTVLMPPRNRDHVLTGQRLAVSLLRGNWLYFPAITWKREAIFGRSFRQDMETVLDLDLIMEVIMRHGKFVLLQEEAFSYRRHRTSISSLTAVDTVRFQEEARLYSELIPRLHELGWARAARAARQHPTSRLHALSMLPRALSVRDWRTARRLGSHVAAPMSGPSARAST